MRRLIPGLALVVIAAGSLLAAGPAAGASTGVIAGRVVNGSTGDPQPGVRLVLTTGTESGDSEVVGRARSDRNGRYRFTGLATGADRFYALDARFDGGLFAGRPVTLPADTTEPPVIRSTMRVWDTTSEPGVIAIERDDMFAVANENGLGVIESVTFVNTSDDAYIGRGAGMLGEAASGASFAFALPPGAQWGGILDSTIDIPQVVEVDQGIAATIAIPPGEHQTTFSFRLEGTGGSFDLSRPALYPTLEMSIYAAAPLEIRSNRLVAGESIELESKTYERWTTERSIDAGDPLQALAITTGTVPLWPLLGAAAAAAVLGVLVTIAARRRRATTEPSARGRTALLEEVAALDLAFQAGELDEAVYGGRRSALVEKLRREGAAR